jgi:hypothetical protein
MIILDVEASGLQLGSFPIEIGFARVLPDRTVATAAKLIRHDELLDEFQLWDATAEGIHRISRANLMEFGRPVTEVARWLNAELAGRVVLIDSRRDQQWVDMVFTAAGLARDFVFADVIDSVRAGAEVDREAFARAIWDIGDRRPHRAEGDARLWAEAYVAALKPGQPARQMWMPGREPAGEPAP